MNLAIHLKRIVVVLADIVEAQRVGAQVGLERGAAVDRGAIAGRSYRVVAGVDEDLGVEPVVVGLVGGVAELRQVCPGTKDRGGVVEGKGLAALNAQ